MNCIKCYREIPEGSRFCPHCGAGISEAGTFCLKCGARLPGDGGQYQKIRRVGMNQYGFGPDAMKQRKVCRICGATMPSEEDFCRICGAVLYGLSSMGAGVL